MQLTLIQGVLLKIVILKIQHSKPIWKQLKVSKQIGIRDLAGLIVIDFIDMLDRNHNYKVEKKLKDSLKSDGARSSGR